MPTSKQAFSGTRGEKKPGRPVATAFTWVLLALLASPSGPWLRSAAAQTPGAYGVAVTPRNFPDFGIEDVDAAFALAKRSAVELAGLQVPYLCLATEINFLAMQRLEEYLHFASLYQETYALVKRIAPQTRVFVSFQWEWMRILDSREPQRIAEHRKVVDIFRPNLDVVGLTTYPSAFHNTPADMVPDYFTWLAHHTLPADEVLLMEVGWPTEGSGNEQEQRQFIRSLPDMLRGVNVSVLAWALLHDVGLEQFDADLNSVGLITTKGRRKPAFVDFKKLHKETRR